MGNEVLVSTPGPALVASRLCRDQMETVSLDSLAKLCPEAALPSSHGHSRPLRTASLSTRVASQNYRTS